MEWRLLRVINGHALILEPLSRYVRSRDPVVDGSISSFIAANFLVARVLRADILAASFLEFASLAS
jgi:hypothetical protein